MSRRLVWVGLLSAILAVAAPLTTASHYAPVGNPSCTPADLFHVYGPYAGARHVGGKATTEVRTFHVFPLDAGADGMARVDVYDGNLSDCPTGAGNGHPDYGDGMPFDNDGDPEVGIMGARSLEATITPSATNTASPTTPTGSGQATGR